MKPEDRMLYRCPCGAEYWICPKEIPLTKEETIFCECGLLLAGRCSTRFFDYERIGSQRYTP